MQRRIKKFIHSSKANHSGQLEYSAGYVDYDGFINEQQLGAEKTFSIGQPIFSKDNEFIGYLGLRLLNNLNYAEYINGFKIPVEHWVIEGYKGKSQSIKTYWQVYGGADNDDE